LDKFIIFDLQALSANEEFEIFIKELFFSTEIEKIGLLFKSQFERLCKTYPSCFQLLRNFVELSEMYDEFYPFEFEYQIEGEVILPDMALEILSTLNYYFHFPFRIKNVQKRKIF
jgi:hypothetical protein